MQAFFKTLAEHRASQSFILGVILIAGALVGIETYPAAVARYGALLHLLDQIVLFVFVAEAVIKIAAEGRAPWRYFRDPWNCFDFAIVVACFLPFQGQAVTVLRLLRLLRVLRLVHALPRLQVLVSALLKSVPSMGYVSLFLGLLFYVYAVAGVFLFGHNDPVHFRSLERAFLALFQIVTLEGWVDVLYTNMYGCDGYGYGAESLLPCTAPAARPVASILYFVSFILLGTMIILNLFIGVIMKSMEEAQEETDRSALARLSSPAPSLGDEIATLRDQLARLERHLRRLEGRDPRV
jgi:voltage-gated sodium channel